MKSIRVSRGLVIAVALFSFALTLPEAEARTIKVKCDEGQSIQSALDRATDGDIIEVSGSCNENVLIVNNRIVLRAVGGATLNGPDTTIATISVDGLNVTIRDFSSLSGGSNVIQVRRNGGAEIQDNTIENGRRGVHVNQGAYARIVGNIIQNNTALPARDGVAVRQSASADILSNTITGNGRHGISVSDSAGADIDDNKITDNAEDGIFVRRTSTIRLSSEVGLGLANQINGNGRNGIRCRQNASVRSGVAQDFTGGNTEADVSIGSDCSTSGTL